MILAKLFPAEVRQTDRDVWRLVIPCLLESLLTYAASLVTSAMIGRLTADDISAQGIGFRGYLAVSGGIRTASLRPRAVEAGERLALHPAAPPALRRMAWDPLPAPGGEAAVLRVTEGVHGARFSPEGLAAFYGGLYRCTADSDRMGLRLSGTAVAFCPGLDGNILSEGMMPGDVQVASDGQPILMTADCQTVGGYAKIAHVIAADLPAAAQLRPGAAVRFRQVTIPEAQAAWRKLWYQMERCLL